MTMWARPLSALGLQLYQALTLVLITTCTTHTLGPHGAAMHTVGVPQVSIDPYSHHKLPVLKMLKRQLRTFRTEAGTNATLTLVFHSNKPVDVHWFAVQMIGGDKMRYPILDDHPYYDINNVISGDVTATTLVIPASQHNKRHTLETVLTTHGPIMQYQLWTILDKPTMYRLDNIDSPEWLLVNKQLEHINKSGTFYNHCQAFFRMKRGSNALMMLHAPPMVGKTQDNMRPGFKLLIQTHDVGQEDRREETGTLVLRGIFHELSRFKALLHVWAHQPHAEREREGLYMCAVERYAEANTLLDKLYLMSYLTYDKHHSVADLIPEVPRVELVTCVVAENSTVPGNTLHLREGRLGCVVCRGLADPAPEVRIYQKHGKANTLDKSHFKHVRMTQFTNTAEAGVIEAFYVFQNPSKSLHGRYVCEAKNENGFNEITFDLKVKHRLSS